MGKGPQAFKVLKGPLEIFKIWFFFDIISGEHKKGSQFYGITKGFACLYYAIVPYGTCPRLKQLYSDSIFVLGCISRKIEESLPKLSAAPINETIYAKLTP